MALYLIANGPMQTTSPFIAVATTTSLLTLLQIKPLLPAKIVEWGISFDGSAAATPGKVELIETDVAATVTASVAADITATGPGVADAAAPATVLTLSTAGTGYTATVEGTITAVRNLDVPIFLPPTAPLIKQFPLGREPVIQVGKFGRIRVKFGTGINAICYMVLEM